MRPPRLRLGQAKVSRQGDAACTIDFHDGYPRTSRRQVAIRVWAVKDGRYMALEGVARLTESPPASFSAVAA